MDNVFLRLYKNNFSDAKKSENFNVSRIIENRLIKMLPNETFLQITNLEENIAFAGNLKVELVNDCNELMKELTVNDNFYYREFTNEKGIKQIAYEFGLINEDFGLEKLYLKLSHTQSLNTWYSSAFYITNYKAELAERFDYKNTDDPYYKSIRLMCFKNDVEIKSEIKEYTQTSGNLISLKPTATPFVKFIFEMCDNANYSSLYNLLNSDIVYCNYKRISNKPALKKGERIEGANFFKVDFEANITNEKYNFQFQIFETLNLTFKEPSGNYVVLPNLLKGRFNKTVPFGVGKIRIYNDVGVLQQEINESQITFTNNKEFEAVLNTLPIGNYYVNVEHILFGYEINNNTEWSFSVFLADFDSDDYDNDDYLT
jgi:hypothetical protein